MGRQCSRGSRLKETEVILPIDIIHQSPGRFWTGGPLAFVSLLSPGPSSHRYPQSVTWLSNGCSQYCVYWCGKGERVGKENIMKAQLNSKEFFKMRFYYSPGIIYWRPASCGLHKFCLRIVKIVLQLAEQNACLGVFLLFGIPRSQLTWYPFDFSILH